MNNGQKEQRGGADRNRQNSQQHREQPREQNIELETDIDLPPEHEYCYLRKTVDNSNFKKLVRLRGYNNNGNINQYCSPEFLLALDQDIRESLYENSPAWIPQQNGGKITKSCGANTKKKTPQVKCSYMITDSHGNRRQCSKYASEFKKYCHIHSGIGATGASEATGTTSEVPS